MLVERFLASGKRIVLGADKNCFPNEPDSPVCTDIPESPLPPGIYGEDTDKDPVDGNRYKTRPRWVNSGTVIGYAEDIVKLYDSMIHSHVPDDNGESDQRIFAWHYYWGNYSISLDYVNDLFASVAFSEAEMMFMGDPGFAERRGIEPWRPAEYRQQKQEEDCDPDDEGKIVPTSWSGRKFPNITIPRAPVIRNDLTDNIPVFLHFPGVARTFMKEFTKRFWWTVGMENAIQILNAYVMNKNVTIAETGDYLTFRNVSLSWYGGY